MKSLVVVSLLLAGAVTLAMSTCTREAHAHIPPMVSLSAKVSSETIEYKVLVVDQVYEKWFDHGYEDLRDISESGQRELAPGFESFMVEHAPVKIDGVVVRPTMKSVTMRERMEENDDLSYVEIEFRYGVKGEIRQLSMVWKQFEALFAITEPTVPLLLEVDEYIDVEFSAREPEYIWHAPIRAPVIARKPTPGGVPVVSVSIIFVLLIAFPVLRRRASRPTMVFTIVVALVSSFVTAGVAQVQVPRFWSSVPEDSEAARIFESLLRNIYRAFDYDTEGAIYDSLAESVGPELLESIYVEVYASLVMKEQGGAVARVAAVKVLELTREGETRDSYDILCKWQVQGTVEHWAHTHLRTNVYEARFTVAWINGAWRIARVEILSQERTGE